MGEGVTVAQASTYNKEDGETICAALAEGHSLLSICEAMGISYSAAVRWEQDIPEHAANSTRAREIGCHAMAQQCLQIADDDTRDWEPIKDQDGQIIGVKVDGEHVQRSKLRIETRMRLIGKWLPKIYGDKLAVGGADDLPAIKTARPLADMSLIEIRAALDKLTK